MDMNLPTLHELGAKPSLSEEHGLALLRPSDKLIFSPGISTAGFAEVRMALAAPDRKVIATTIDRKGLTFTDDLIAKLGLGSQIETKFENLLDPWSYAPGSFDFIFSRLVLHYLPADDLDTVLHNFAASLKSGGMLFVVVQSTKNVDPSDPNFRYDPITHLSSVSKFSKDGRLLSVDKRYFHTDESIQEHLRLAGFSVTSIQDYDEQLYHDYARTDEAIGNKASHLIEVVAVKST